MAFAKKYLSLFILSSSVVASILIVSQSPEVKVTNENQKMIPVSVLDVESSKYEPKAGFYGYVQSAKVQTLTAKLDGEIIKLHPAFIPGAVISTNEIVYELDKQDYIDSLAKLTSNLAIETANLELELGQQQLAEKDVAQYKQTSRHNNQDKASLLALRKPQLTIAQAKKIQAQLALQKVKRDIEKASLVAKGNLIVTKQFVQEGDFVSVGQPIGEVAYLDAIWVKVSVSSDIATHLNVGSKANVSLLGKEQIFSSYISHIDNAVDPSNQQVNVYVAMAHYKNQVRLNEFVSVELVLPELNKTLAVPSQLVQDGKMWVLEQDLSLARLPVDILWQSQDTTWVEANFAQAVKPLSHVVPSQFEGHQAILSSVKL